MDASAAFDPLNTSITLLYSICAVGALPLGVLSTSDELEITLEKALNLLKTILPSHAFYGRGAEVGPIVFLTDDSSAERNSLELCWPQGIRLLCTFHVLWAFWRWLHDSKHHIKKEDRAPIMEKMKKILYSTSGPEMDVHYNEFKQKFYVYIKSGSMIRVQVKSIKRRKSGSSSGGKRKIAANISEGKENMDPQIIPTRKKKKSGKKEHNFKNAHR
ncbi:unnamed protein product [Rhizophagus irregularis]|uniref:MULE transposase domain-containing protein n=1 Tax=Rhizophagus irregularis TaxID=588596 RepID=A0A916E1M1_9GLOM|nr:unnamed protein product [Rhizophagus irregularis]